MLPAVKQLAKPVHFAALPYRDLPAFMAKLRQQQGGAARALELLILTAARSGEVLGATWGEINLANAVWTVPPQRMKAHKEHRVPLSAPALELLRDLPREPGNDLVFIGAKAGGGLSDTTFSRLLKRMGGNGNVTAHGFRSAFSDWAHEQTAHAAHTIEISLAHAVGNAVEQSYRRGDLIAKRKQLMDSWAKFTTSKPMTAGDNVVPLGEGSGR